MLQEDGIPKIFISYAWGSSDLVLELAQRLVSHGVDVVLDKWDLKEGQDKYAFMERCVNDSEITKVLIICDKAYAQKANERTGGVGDETVIISSEIYGNTKQEKFIPIIAEKMRKDNLMSLHISKQEYTLIYRTKKHMRLNMKNFLEIFMRSHSLLNLN